jgi:hypothetical protein
MKLKKLLLSAAMVLTVLALGACSMKTSVLKDVNMTFKGMNGEGTVEVGKSDGQKLIDNIVDTLAKKADLDDYLTEKIKDGIKENGNDDDDDGYDDEEDDEVTLSSLEKNATSDERDGLVKFSRWIKELKMTNSKETGLKNGDKFKVIVRTGDKENPIKEETKIYTVKGLK